MDVRCDEDRVRNEHIRGTIRVTETSKTVTEKRLQVVRTCNEGRGGKRREEEHVVRRVLEAETGGKRRRGRLKTGWRRVRERRLTCGVEGR